MATTFLTTEELSLRIKYDARTIRERLKDSEAVNLSTPAGGWRGFRAMRGDGICLARMSLG